MPIYYAINLDIVSLFMVFNNLYFDLLIYSKFETIKLFLVSKKQIKEERKENR